MAASHEDSQFAEELPKFVTHIKAIFEPHEIIETLDEVESGELADPSQIFKGDPDEELI